MIIREFKESDERALRDAKRVERRIKEGMQLVEIPYGYVLTTNPEKWDNYSNNVRWNPDEK